MSAQAPAAATAVLAGGELVRRTGLQTVLNEVGFSPQGRRVRRPDRRQRRRQDDADQGDPRSGLAEFSGRVLINGAATLARNSLIGYVPQKIDLDPDMPLRARDLIALGLDGHRYGIPRPSAQRNARVEEMVAAVGARSVRRRADRHLSGGEQQRVMIAHALISRRRSCCLMSRLRTWICAAARRSSDCWRGSQPNKRVAILLSAHDMNPLLPVMDRVVYLADGPCRQRHRGADHPCTETLSELYRHPSRWSVSGPGCW
jgi:zinc/manganese transport system ATP-binding protein